MTWAPTKKVFDITPIVENILNYTEEFGADALALANGEALPDWVTLLPNAPGQLLTMDMFPALICLDQAYETDLSGEILQGGLELKFEGCVTGPVLNDLVYTAKRYAEAFEMILANIPSEDLTFGCKATTTGWLLECGTTLDSSGQLQTATNYLAIYQTKCLFGLTMAAY